MMITSDSFCLLDLDGTIYHGSALLKGAREFLKELQQRRIPFCFLTNNAMRTPKQNLERLQKMGVRGIESRQFFTSAMAAASYAASLQRGKRVFCIGEEGLKQALLQQGFILSEEGSDIVVVGLKRNADYMEYTKAMRELQRGALFLATNPDHRVPQEEGDLIGNGAVIRMLEYSSEKKAIICGKPEGVMMNEVLRYVGRKKEECIMIGDNLETDVLFGLRHQVATVFVTSGLHTKEDAEKRGIHPDRIVCDLRELIQN